MHDQFAAGQRWTYAAPAGFEQSRLVIGAILEFAGEEPIICCMVTSAPQRNPQGGTDCVTIPFLPMTRDAFARTALVPDGEAAVTPHFAQAYQSWKSDERGLSFFSVPFPGYLDKMIALQMLSLVEAQR